MGVGRGEEVCRKGCPYIRQLANKGWPGELELELKCQDVDIDRVYERRLITSMPGSCKPVFTIY